MTRDEAIRRVQKMITYMETLDADEEEQKDMEAYRMSVKALKAQKIGKWIDSTIPESTLMMCSVCKYNLGSFRFNYCPNCGAKMVGTTCDCFRQEFGKDVCYGTRERDECTCKGDRGKCDFYGRGEKF